MTISSTNRKAGPFSGTGATSIFPFNFKIFQASDLQVVQADFNGNQTLLVLDTDYTASLNANQDVDPGGQITLTAGPLVTGLTLVISSSLAQLQGTDLTNAGGFYPEVITAALDLLTILIQQLQEQADRALSYPITDDVTAQLPSAAERAGKILYFGADGSPSLLATAPPGTLMFAGPMLGTQDGVNTVFQLTNDGSPLAVTPVQATVWNNFALVRGIGWNYGPEVGQVTLTTAPAPTDSLFAQGVFVP